MRGRVFVEWKSLGVHSSTAAASASFHGQAVQQSFLLFTRIYITRLYSIITTICCCAILRKRHITTSAVLHVVYVFVAIQRRRRRHSTATSVRPSRASCTIRSPNRSSRAKSSQINRNLLSPSAPTQPVTSNFPLHLPFFSTPSRASFLISCLFVFYTLEGISWKRGAADDRHHHHQLYWIDDTRNPLTHTVHSFVFYYYPAIHHSQQRQLNKC